MLEGGLLGAIYLRYVGVSQHVGPIETLAIAGDYSKGIVGVDPKHHLVAILTRMELNDVRQLYFTGASFMAS